MHKSWPFFLLALFLLNACDNLASPDPFDLPLAENETYENELPGWLYPYNPAPEDNQATVLGVKLGRRLFYDKILSDNGSTSCATCHQQEKAFAGIGLNKGVRNTLEQERLRNAPALFNLFCSQTYFWDGSGTSLEEQVILPVEHPGEMASNWDNVLERIKEHQEYPRMFHEAFGEKGISVEKVAKAIAQFERTLVSAGSRFDEVIVAGTSHVSTLPENAQRGYNIFFNQAKCFYCHGDANLTRGAFYNLGLDDNFYDPNNWGRYDFTGDINDMGAFRTPSLRNIEFTAPYMHDGRFQTLQEVVDFYSDGMKESPYVSPLVNYMREAGIFKLTEQEKADLVAFMKTFSDEAFVTNPDFSNPFE